MSNNIDLHLELTVLRGPVPPVNGVIQGGVVGELHGYVLSVRKILVGIAVAFFAGIGGTFAWVYAAGLSKGREINRIELIENQLREDSARIKLIEGAVFGKAQPDNWLSPGTRVTPDP